MNKIITLALILTWTTLFASPNNSQINQSIVLKLLEKHGTHFANLEHENLGNSVVLHFIGGQPPSSNRPLNLDNGLSLTYGEILMLSGDFFADENNPISQCENNKRKECFLKNFQMLAGKEHVQEKNCKNPFVLSKRIKDYLNELDKNIQNAKKNGIPEWKFYNKNSSQITKKLNKASCGGSLVTALIPYGRYIKLAQANFDHFMPDSKIAYKTGHEVALETALKAHKKFKEDKIFEAAKILELAYAQNAFASHFLTDSFSSGHLRTPRKAIDKHVYLPKALKLLITNLMHNEDNQLGLNVVNASGSSWKAYGDGYLNTHEAHFHRNMIEKALQLSVDSIFFTFFEGKKPEHYRELDLFIDINHLNELNNNQPLFKVKDGKLLKRKDNHNASKNEYTFYWNAVVTLLQFYI